MPSKVGRLIKICYKCKKPILKTEIAIEITLAKPLWVERLNDYIRKRQIARSYHEICFKESKGEPDEI